MEQLVNKDSSDKVDDEVLLPGFRFHPTDEELVGFYLRRKIQQRPLSIELIKQLDIYKFDPWDLPKFASNGEKEWYFYCPRDRKYRNSARPNRVTGAGFWKATGTDRPIYSSEGNKCIGLKKSLVFYKGRAAKGIKTDWMMHEFRLPTTLAKMAIHNNLPANDSWAICRIFKKSSPISSRTHSHTWVSNENTIKATSSSPTQPMMNSSNINNESDKVLHSPNNDNNNNNNNNNKTTISFLNHIIPTFKPIYPTTTSNYNNLFPNIAASLLELPPSYMLPTLEDLSEQSLSNINFSPMLLNMSSVLRKFDKHADDDINLDFGMLSTINGECHDFSPVQLSQDHIQHVNFVDDQQDFDNTTLLENMNIPFHGEDDGHQGNGIDPIGNLLWSDMPEVWNIGSHPPL